MRKTNSFWPRVTACAILSSIMISCASNGQSPATSAPKANTTPAGPVYHISANGTAGQPVKITNIKKGVTEYTLLAQSVLYATNLQRGKFADTTLYFYKGRTPRLTVTAPTAFLDEQSHNVALSGGVVAKTAAGVTLSSDTMRYDERTRLLTAIGHVVANEPGGNTLTGSRAVADLDLQEIRLFGEGSPQPSRSALP